MIAIGPPGKIVADRIIPRCCIEVRGSSGILLKGRPYSALEAEL